MRYLRRPRCLAVMVFHVGPALAYGDQPWCAAVVYDHSMVRSCHFADVRGVPARNPGGNRGFCEQNPDCASRGRPAEAPKRRHKRHVNRDERPQSAVVAKRPGLLAIGTALAAGPVGSAGISNGCGCSSGVEHDLAKVGVEGSNPFARSNLRSSGASVGEAVLYEGCPP